MWIDRHVYEQMLMEGAALGAKAQALEVRFAALDTTLDWMRVRLEQVERERARLIKKYTDVDIDIPTIQRVPEQPVTEAVLNEATAFDDVGDELAKRLGIGWKPDGTLEYTKRA